MVVFRRAPYSLGSSSAPQRRRIQEDDGEEEAGMMMLMMMMMMMEEESWHHILAGGTVGAGEGGYISHDLKGVKAHIVHLGPQSDRKNPEE